MSYDVLHSSNLKEVRDRSMIFRWGWLIELGWMMRFFPFTGQIYILAKLGNLKNLSEQPTIHPSHMSIHVWGLQALPKNAVHGQDLNPVFLVETRCNMYVPLCNPYFILHQNVTVAS